MDIDEPTIVVDDRERPSGIVETLEEAGLFEICVERLDIGDFVIADLVIERKAAPDFFESVQDGRLFKQLSLARRASHRRLLIIEGTLAPRSAWSQTRIESVFTKIAVSFQIPTLYSSNLQQTARLILRIAIQHFGLSTSPLIYRHKPLKRDLRFQQVYILVGIPGIGVKRAERLLDHFGSLKEVFSATKEELRQVEGVGMVHADQITAPFCRRSGTFLRTRDPKRPCRRGSKSTRNIKMTATSKKISIV